jgi:RNA polymerase sigma-70 factor, ECF subfamily
MELEAVMNDVINGERDDTGDEIGQDFEVLRPLLFAIAYRMLGTAGDAEDVVQEAYLRYQAADPHNIRSTKAFLTTVVTRLSIDQLKSARRQRESYVGAWLPEPLLTTPGDQPADLAALNDSLSTALLVLLETLNPVERAVFLLHEVFDYDYAAIAEIVGKSEAACRQALHRARTAVRSGKPRFQSTADEHRVVFTRFLEACAEGDVEALEAILAADVTAVADSGGKASAATRPLHGSKVVAAFMLGLFKRAPVGLGYELTEINGRKGLIIRQDGTVVVSFTADVAGGKITAVWAMRNPDKLGRL